MSCAKTSTPLSTAACSAGARDDFRVEFNGPGGSSYDIIFQGKLSSQDFGSLACTPSAGSCPMATVSDGIPSFISEYQPDGTLVTSAIGSGVTGAKYVGVNVYGSNHDVYAADAASSSSAKVYVFAAGNLAGPPAHTIDGSNTPAGSLVFQGNYAEHISVNQSNGDLYAVDGPPHRVVDRFTASGAYLSQFAYTGGLNGATDVSVNNSGGPNDGDLYLNAFTDNPEGGVGDPVTGHGYAVDAFDSSYQHLDALSHKAYDADPKFANATPTPGVAVGVGADSGHLYWSMGQISGGVAGRGKDLYRFDAGSGDLTDLTYDDSTEKGADVARRARRLQRRLLRLLRRQRRPRRLRPGDGGRLQRLERRRQPRRLQRRVPASTSPTAVTSPSSPASTPPSPTPRTTPGSPTRATGSAPGSATRKSAASAPTASSSSAPSAGSAPTTTRARSAASTAAPTRSPDPAGSSTATPPAMPPPPAFPATRPGLRRPGRLAWRNSIPAARSRCATRTPSPATSPPTAPASSSRPPTSSSPPTSTATPAARKRWTRRSPGLP